MSLCVCLYVSLSAQKLKKQLKLLIRNRRNSVGSCVMNWSMLSFTRQCRETIQVKLKTLPSLYGRFIHNTYRILSKSARFCGRYDEIFWCFFSVHYSSSYNATDNKQTTKTATKDFYVIFPFYVLEWITFYELFGLFSDLHSSVLVLVLLFHSVLFVVTKLTARLFLSAR